jgi:membrane protein YqaA with SNARE-associated domain
MRTLSRHMIVLFATPLGVVALAALDSTLFFSVPFGIDAVVIILAARLHGLWWIVPLLATGGSLAGAAFTFWMGVKIGDHGLERWIAKKRLAKIRKRVRESGAIALAALDLAPPPFPFSACVLAAGALDVRRSTFFVTLTACRLVRFGLESSLALAYGRHILRWMDAPLFHDVVSFFLVVAVILTAISIVQVVRSLRPTKRRRATA